MGKRVWIESPWAKEPGEITKKLDVDVQKGLSQEEAGRRYRGYGANTLRKKKKKNAWIVFLNQFNSVIIFLLFIAAVLSFIFDKNLQGAAILVALVINASVGFLTELKAVRSVEALEKMGKVFAKVLRDGGVKRLRADKLVPGDIIMFAGGDVIAADMRVYESSKLEADESVLTGESMPVYKGIDPASKDAELADRASMVFKGTCITRGSGKGIVTATGTRTEIGRISSLVEGAEDEVTPLEKRLNGLGNNLIWVTIFIAVLLALLGIFYGKPVFIMVETSIALAVAAVPESLPVVATIALARGMWRMAKKNAVVRKLSSVETLGATSVIFVDKTGTLTENRMSLRRIILEAGEIELAENGKFKLNGKEIDVGENENLKKITETGVLCNNASLPEDEKDRSGEPLEIALLEAGKAAGINRKELLEEIPQQKEVAFDPELKMMATYHKSGERYRVAVKGAPEAVLEACSFVYTPGKQPRKLSEDEKKEWERRAGQMAAKGLRVLALAEKVKKNAGEKPYRRLVLLGIAGFADPPREEIKPYIEKCHKAGMRIVMVTGDQSLTAKSVATSLGIVKGPEAEVILGQQISVAQDLSDEQNRRFLDANIFARVSPAKKLGILSLYREKGFIVAMTGDGVNDAPALKKADIGIAMAKRGTQVASQAADMVLKDDSFSTIVAAVEQGRVIFANIRKFLLYLIPCHVSEVTAIALAPLLKMPLPVLPLQILFLNIVTDTFPALALGMSEGSPGVMNEPPRDPEEPVITRKQWFWITAHGVVMGLAVIAALYFAIHYMKNVKEKAVTVSFLTLGFTSLWHVFNVRAKGSGILKNDIVSNPFVWAAVFLGVVLMVSAVFIPGFNNVIGLEAPDMNGWGLALFLSFVPLVIGQVMKKIRPK